jgi:TonB family protein
MLHLDLLRARLKFLIGTVVLLWAVTAVGQAVQPPATSVMYERVSPTDSQPDLEFLRIGLHPAFGPAYSGSAASFGVFHSDRKERDFTLPVLFYAPDPIYPAGVTNRQKTSVRVGFIVWMDGTPRYIRVLRSGGDEFDTAATNAVNTWRYYPGAKAGRVGIFDATADVMFVPRCNRRNCR